VSPIARLGGLTLSVLLHVGGAAALVALSTADWAQPPLFVDLVEPVEYPGGPAAGAAGGRAAVPAPPRGARAPGRAGPTTRPARPVGTVAPARPAAPTPAPSATPVVPLEPDVAASTSAPLPMASAPTLTPPPMATPRPAPAVPTAPSGTASAAPGLPPSTAAAPGRVGASEPGLGVKRAGETRNDAAGVGGGSPLALALPGGGAVPAEYGPYLQRFRRRVQEMLVYPLAARRQGLGGTVELDVWLEATGRVRDVRIVRSSSHALLDEAAVEAIRRLGPLPFPESLPRRPLLIRLPLVFELR